MITKETIDEVRTSHAVLMKIEKEYEEVELRIRNQRIRFENSVNAILYDRAVEDYMRMKIRRRDRRKAQETETEFHFDIGNGFVEVHGVWESFSGARYYSKDGFMIPFDDLPDIEQRNGNDIFKEYYVRNIQDFKNNLKKTTGRKINEEQ